MPVETRSLRVSAELDASKYAAGAQQITNASKAAVAANRDLGLAFTENVQKVTSTVTGFSALERRYDANIRQTMEFEKAIRSVSRALDTEVVSAERLGSLLDNINQKYGRTADVSKILARGQTEFANAVQLANERFERQTVSLARSQRFAAANGNVPSGYTANIAAQFQDIGVTAAMGANPLQVALQQGTQLSAVLNEIKRDGQSAIGVLAGAFGSLLSPISLITLGVTAAGAAAIQYFTSSRDAADGANTALAAGNSLIRDVARAWGDATPNLKAYVDELDRADNIAKGREAGGLLAGRELDGLGERLQGLNQGFAATMRGLRGIGADPAFIRDFGQAFGDLRTRLDNGTASTADYVNAQRELDEAVSRYGIPSVLSFRSEFDKITLSIRNSIEAAKQARSEWISAIAGGNNVQDIVAGSTFRTGGKTYHTNMFTPVNGPTPQSRPLIELEGLPGETKGERSTADAYRDLIKSANDRIEQMKLEASVAAETGIAAEKMRMQLDLLQQAQEKGRTVTAEQRVEIEKLAEAYGRAATEAAKVRLRADLQFERDQLFRSPENQQIASRQRGLGMPVDLNSQEAQIMRDNMRIEELRNGVKGFFTDFRDGLMQGDRFGEALGNSIVNALLNATTKISDRFIDQLVNSLLGSTANGGLLSRLGIGSIAANDNFVANTTLGKLLGANDNIGKAPIIPVTRAPLGDIASYAAAIKSIESGGNYSALGPVTATGDRAYGAYQVMGANVAPWTRRALGYSLSPSQFLANPAAQDAVFNDRFGGYVGRYGASGAAQAWFGGPGSVGRGSSWADQLGTTGTQYVDKFYASLSRLSGTADVTSAGFKGINPALGSAAQGLNQFGSGVGTFGQKLADAFPPAPSSGGGLFSKLFGGLFGGGLNAFGMSVLGSSAQFASAWASGGIGLYASGTDFAPGGLAVVGEGGRELVNLPRGSQVIPNHRTEAMLSGVRGGSPNIVFKTNVINNNGSNVRTQRRDTNEGPQFDIIIDEAVANNLSTPGSRSRRAVKSQFALSETLARR